MGGTWVDPSNAGTYQDTTQYNGGIGNWMSNNALGLGIGGMAGIAGAIPQNSTQTTNGTSALQTLQNLFGSSNINSTNNGTSNTSVNTGYGTQGQGVIGESLPVLSRMLQGTNLNDNYVPQQIQNINSTSNAQQQNLDSELAARGLSTSPVAATAAAGVGQQRSQAINQVQQQAPLLQQQLESQALGSSGNFLSQLPRNTNTGTTQTTTGTQAGTTNQIGNSTQNGSNHSTTQNKAGGGIGGFFGGLAGTLASLVSINYGILRRTKYSRRY